MSGDGGSPEPAGQASQPGPPGGLAIKGQGPWAFKAGDLGRFISDETREYLRMLARVSSMGIAMVLATLMGFGLGYWVDTLWDGVTAPWGKLVGLILGIVAGYRNIYVIMKRSKYL